MSYKDDRFRIDTESEEYQDISLQTHAKVEGEMTPSEAWYCMEKSVKDAYKIEDGLLDVIDRLQKKYDYLSMAYDIEQDIRDDLEKQLSSAETQLYEQGMGDDL